MWHEWGRKRRDAKLPRSRNPRGLFTGVEAAEITANQVEQSSKITGKQPPRDDTPESSDGEVMVRTTPPRPAGETDGGITITLTLRNPER
jgi:hypothetical protein